MRQPVMGLELRAAAADEAATADRQDPDPQDVHLQHDKVTHSLRLRWMVFVVVMSGLVISTVGVAGDFCFIRDEMYAVGNGPCHFSAADLDGDGDIDLAVAYGGSDNVSVLKNNGDGNFAAPIDYNVPNDFHSVFAADIDGDNDCDLAVTNRDANTVTVLKNNGDGTFANAADYAVGSAPLSVAAADLDGDDDIDLAVANHVSHDISVLRNHGDGSFAAATHQAAGNHPHSIATADVDGDSDIDVVVLSRDFETLTYNVSVLKNKGDATFQTPVNYVTGDRPTSVCVADLDGDVDIDLAITNCDSNHVSVFENNGDGTYQAPVNYAAGYYPWSVVADDLDGDNDPDLAVANCRTNYVTVVNNNGDGTLDTAVHIFGGFYNPLCILAADLDGDSDIDLACVNPAIDAVSVLANCLVPEQPRGEVPCSPLHIFTGEVADNHFGEAVSGAGDVDNDGYADLIVGAPQNDAGGSAAGRAYVYSGRSGTLLWIFSGEAAGEEFGWSVSGAGDVDADGFHDLIIGSFYPNGRANVYSGKTGLLLWSFTGEEPSDYLGISVSGAGDVDSDGFADLIVGASGMPVGGPTAGRVYVYSGRTGTTLWTFTGEALYDWFGRAVSGAGDVDNDGHADMIVGALANDAGGTGAGRAYVYSGRTGTTLWTFTGEAAGDKFGASVSGASDVDKDGYADVFVGAPDNDANGNRAGRAYVYSGRTGATLWTFDGEAAEDHFGTSVSGAGHLDCDEYADLIVGAYTPLMTDNDHLVLTDSTHPELAIHEDVGRMYIYSGRTGTLLWTLIGEARGDQFGGSVSGAGDVDGDGHGDVIVGARGNSSGAGRAYVFACAPSDIAIDILPGQCPNVISTLELRSITPPGASSSNDREQNLTTPVPARVDESIEVAVLGEADLDVTNIEDGSLLLAGVAPRSYRLADVSCPPPTQESPCECFGMAPDGYTDLVLSFSKSEMLAALNPVSDGDHLTLTLDALTKTGCSLTASDCVSFGVQTISSAAVPSTAPAVSSVSNYPNPFNAATVITYTIAGNSPVRLEIFDVLGRRVATLVDGPQSAGSHQVIWNGTNSSGRRVASGMYFYRLTVNERDETRKMVLLR